MCIPSKQFLSRETVPLMKLRKIPCETCPLTVETDCVGGSREGEGDSPKSGLFGRGEEQRTEAAQKLSSEVGGGGGGGEGDEGYVIANMGQSQCQMVEV